jgi:hypothetical protein
VTGLFQADDAHALPVLERQHSPTVVLLFIDPTLAVEGSRMSVGRIEDTQETTEASIA